MIIVPDHYIYSYISILLIKQSLVEGGGVSLPGTPMRVRIM